MASSRSGTLAVLAVVVAGCVGAPPSTPAPSLTSSASLATPGATPGATPSAPAATPGETTAPTPDVTPAPIDPTPTPLPPCEADTAATTFQPDSIVCVVEGPLRVRSRPNTSDASVKFEPLLQTGQLLFVIDGPTSGSGYTWYLVQDTPGPLVSADGWVAAAARDGTPWLASATLPCPANPSLQDLAVMDTMQRVHCYGAREFTFTNTVIAGPNCGDGGVLESPTWMAGCPSTFWWGDQPYKSLIVAIPPALADDVGPVDLDEGRVEATITAHMDDPAARTCVPYEGVEADYALLRPGIVLMCRGIFVATSFQRLSP